ncbi:MAG: ATP synthase subunit beta [Patescibacteria group bacterium]|nr:MAG: ATP synthase subunit beta [Patescibacteria group bacterium]
MKKTGKIIAIQDNVAIVEFLLQQPAIFDVLVLKNNPEIKLEVVSSAQENQTYYCFILNKKNEISRGDIVENTEQNLLIPVGKEVLGRAIDVFGNAQDNKDFKPKRFKSLHTHIPTEVDSAITPSEILTTGIRAIDFFTPVLKGSKIGLVGGAGLGKTILLTELIHNVVVASNANKESVSVFAAVGERSREAHELLENLAESKVLDKTVMIVGQMGENPAVRFRTAYAAATVAEDFRDHGTDVLFFMDNMYRFSQAGYELSTLMHAVPSEDGYQPTLPSEVGTFHEMLTSTPEAYITSIEAIYLPSDDLLDYSVRSALYYLDSYIVLSRDIYQSGRLPAIDLLASNSSAVNPEVIGQKHFELYLKCTQILEQAKDIEKIVSLVGLSELSIEDQTVYKRSILIENYMTQSLTVAEPQTNRKGVFAQNRQTLDDIEIILSGKLDNIDPEKLLYIEKIDQSILSEPTKTTVVQPEQPKEPPVSVKPQDLEPAFPLKKPLFKIQLPFQKKKRTSYIEIDPSHPPMTLTPEEVTKIKEEQKEVELARNRDMNIEEKYKALLIEGAELQTKHGIQPQRVENMGAAYSPTQMTDEKT